MVGTPTIYNIISQNKCATDGVAWTRGRDRTFNEACETRPTISGADAIRAVSARDLGWGCMSLQKKRDKSRKIKIFESLMDVRLRTEAHCGVRVLVFGRRQL